MQWNFSSLLSPEPQTKTLRRVEIGNVVTSEAKKKYREKNKQKISEYNKKYHESHKSDLNIKSKKYKQTYATQISKYNQEYYAANRLKFNSICKIYYQENKSRISIRSAAYRLRNKDVLRVHKQDYDASPQAYTLRRSRNYSKWREYLLNSARGAAKRRNLDFSITIDDIDDPDQISCPIFGTAFTIGTGKQHDHSATIDRIDNSKGYIPGNVWIISGLANRIKHESSYPVIRQLGLTVMAQELINKVNIYDDVQTRSIRQRMVSMRKFHNKHRNQLVFTIDWFHIDLPRFCPCLGIELNHSDHGDRGNWRNFVTIDRIDNSKGYIPGNVWTISSLANAMKTNATGAQILRLAHVLERKLNNK